MSDRICYLHVGTGKTGSSSMQFALTQAADALLARGYLYPDASDNFSKVLAGKPTAGNAARINWHLRDESPERAIESIKPYSTGSLHLVLSCEGISNRSADDLEGFGAGLRNLGYNAKCLVFFRPQAEWVVSSYLQQIKSNKQRSAVDLNAFATRQLAKNLERRWNWYVRARKLERAFGKQNLTVKWYPAVRRLGPGGVVDAVLEWLGLLSLRCAAQSADQFVLNPTPGREALMILRCVNSSGIGGKEFADEFLSCAQQAGLLGNKVSLDRQTMELIHVAMKESNSALLERYCSELSSDAELELPLLPEKEPPSDGGIIRELASIASDILARDAGATRDSLRDVFRNIDAHPDLIGQRCGSA